MSEPHEPQDDPPGDKRQPLKTMSHDMENCGWAHRTLKIGIHAETGDRWQPWHPAVASHT